MIRVPLSNDSNEELKDDLVKYLSSCLPHSRYVEGDAHKSLQRVERLLHLDEMTEHYYIVFNALSTVVTLSSVLHTEPVFSRDSLDSYLKSGIVDMILGDTEGFSNFLDKESLPSNLSIPQNLQTCASLVYTRSLELYDAAFELELTFKEALAHWGSLVNNYVRAVADECTKAQVFLLRENGILPAPSYFFGWRKFLKSKSYAGIAGWLQLMSYVTSSMTRRISEAEVVDTNVSNLDTVLKWQEEAISANSVLAYYDIPPYDNECPIVKTQYTILIGERNVGKTTVAINWLVSVMLEGKKVVIFSEENADYYIFYSMIVPCYVAKKYGQFITTEQALGMDSEDEDLRQLINTSIKEIYESKLLYILSELNAWTAYQSLAKLYSEFQFDYIVIDHTLSLGGGLGENSTQTDKINQFSSHIKRFKKDFNVSVCVLSHPVTGATKIVLNKSDNASELSGLTKYSKQIEGDADNIYFMYNTPELKSKHQVALRQTKARGGSVIDYEVRLRVSFAHKIYQYYSEDQGKFGTDVLSESDMEYVISDDDAYFEDDDE